MHSDKKKEDELIWTFKVINSGGEAVPFQHVMHPLLSLDRIKEVHLPGFNTVFDDIKQELLDLKTAGSVCEFLFSLPAGSASMLFLQQVEQGRINWKYDRGLRVEAEFPHLLFPKNSGQNKRYKFINNFFHLFHGV